jgi:hypothetical protein
MLRKSIGLSVSALPNAKTEHTECRRSTCVSTSPSPPPPTPTASRTPNSQPKSHTHNAPHNTHPPPLPLPSHPLHPPPLLNRQPHLRPRPDQRPQPARARPKRLRNQCPPHLRGGQPRPAAPGNARGRGAAAPDAGAEPSAAVVAQPGGTCACYEWAEIRADGYGVSGTFCTLRRGVRGCFARWKREGRGELMGRAIGADSDGCVPATTICGDRSDP